MAPFVLKFKGNKSFSPFSNLADSESLTRTWKVCTKVAAHLEQGQRLENLAWRLFFIHNVMVDSDSARSKRDFKKMTKFMGERLDKEKGRSIEELQAPGFKRTDSVDKLVKRAVEKERSREEALLNPHISGVHNPNGGSMKGMQYTFSVNPNAGNAGAHPPRHQLNNGGVKRKNPPTSVSGPIHHGDEPMLVSASAPSSGRHSRSNSGVGSGLMMTPLTAMDPTSAEGALTSSRTSSVTGHSPSTSLSASPNSIQSTLPSSLASSVTSLPDQVTNSTPGVLRFPTLFSSDFGPGALLCTPSSLGPSLSYGEDARSGNDSWVIRPAFEFPLDEIMNGDGEGWNLDTEMKDATPTPGPVSAVESSTAFSTPTSEHPASSLSISIPSAQSSSTSFLSSPIKTEFSLQHHDENALKSPTLIPLPLSPPLKPSSGPGKQRTRRRGNSTMLPPPAIPSRSIHMTTSAASSSAQSRSVAPSATPPPRGIRQYVNSAPGGVKSECANCGANSTPLWRRGLNDELNCNACGLFAKLHKRPRPKSLRANTGDTGTRTTSWASGTIHTPVEGNDTPAEQVQCYNCQTTATPLWRKDEEGRTLCNACGLYLKLHGEKRPSSMKSDVIRKRSRHDGRRGSSSAATPSASPGASRRTSPVRAHSPLPQEPTYAPAPPPQYDFGPNFDFSHQSPPDSTSADLMSMGMGLSTGEDHHSNFNMPFTPMLFAETSNYPGPVSTYNLAAYWQHLGAPTNSSGMGNGDSSMDGNNLTDSLVESLVDPDGALGGGGGNNKRRRVSPDDDTGSISMESSMDSSVTLDSPTVDLSSTFIAHSDSSNNSSQNSNNSIDAGLNLSFDALSFSYNPFSYAFSAGESFIHPPMLLPYADPMSSLGHQQSHHQSSQHHSHSHSHHSPSSSAAHQAHHHQEPEDIITPDPAEPQSLHHSLQ